MATAERIKALVGIYELMNCWAVGAPVPGNISPQEVPCTGGWTRLAGHPDKGSSHATPRVLLSDSQPNVLTSQIAGHPMGKTAQNVKTGLCFKIQNFKKMILRCLLSKRKGNFLICKGEM